MRCYVCDLGGTRIKLGLVQDGRVLRREVISARGAVSLAALLPEFRRILCGFSAPEACGGLVMGYPGLVDSDMLHVSHPTGKYADAAEMDLQAWCQDTLGMRFVLENDARLAAWGEWRYGAGVGADNFVMMTFGTGIGTAAVVDGHLLRGRGGLAGSYGGHLTLELDGPKCSCGNQGCVESLASTSVLPRLSEELCGKAFTGNYPELFQSEEPLWAPLQAYTLNVWGRAAVNLVHAYDPERIVLGGGIAACCGERLMDAIRLSLQTYATLPKGVPAIRVSPLGDDAALLGGTAILASLQG